MRYLILVFFLVLASCSSKPKLDFGEVLGHNYKNKQLNVDLDAPSTWYVHPQHTLLKFNEHIQPEKKGAPSIKYLFMVQKENPSSEGFNASFLVTALELGNGVESLEDYWSWVRGTRKNAGTNDRADCRDEKIGASNMNVCLTQIDHEGVTILQEHYNQIVNGYVLSYVLSYISDAEKQELFKILE